MLTCEMTMLSERHSKEPCYWWLSYPYNDK